MDEGKVPIEKLEKMMKLQGFLNSGVVTAGEIGKDAAVVNFLEAQRKAQKYYNSSKEAFIVLKTDPITFPTPEPGKYAVLVNANDVACSGALSFGFLPTLIYPPSTTFEKILEIQEQIHDECMELGITILGGHSEISNSVNTPIVSGNMIGFVPSEYLVPNDLKLGDQILIVGYPGTEGTGIIIAEAGTKITSILNEDEVKCGIALGSSLSISQLIIELNKKFQPNLFHDLTEGGCFGALYELVKFKDVGIKLFTKPSLSSVTKKLASSLSFDPYYLISSGAFFVSANPETILEIQEYLSNKSYHCQVIGEVTEEGSIVRLGELIIQEPNGDEITTALKNLVNFNGD